MAIVRKHIEIPPERISWGFVFVFLLIVLTVGLCLKDTYIDRPEAESVAAAAKQAELDKTRVADLQKPISNEELCEAMNISTQFAKNGFPLPYVFILDCMKEDKVLSRKEYNDWKTLSNIIQRQLLYQQFSNPVLEQQKKVDRQT